MVFTSEGEEGLLPALFAVLGGEPLLFVGGSGGLVLVIVVCCGGGVGGV
jgi:hypothetical protein